MENLTLQAVEDLNQMLFDEHGETDLCFIYTTNGNSETVEFNGAIIWDTENDERVFDESVNDYPPILPHLIDVFNAYCDKVYAFKLKKENPQLS